MGDQPLVTAALKRGGAKLSFSQKEDVYNRDNILFFLHKCSCRKFVVLPNHKLEPSKNWSSCV